MNLCLDVLITSTYYLNKTKNADCRQQDLLFFQVLWPAFNESSSILETKTEIIIFYSVS